MNMYAQLDENNIVVAVSQLSGEVDAPNMIEIPEYDTSLLGKKYNALAKEWEVIVNAE
jgi:hypothetical protein